MARPSTAPRRAAGAAPAEPFPDQSYLAYIRPTPPPFVRFTCGHFPPGTVTVAHSHSCLALHGCIQGPLSIVTPAGAEALDAGTFLLIPPGMAHHWRNDGRHTAATFALLIDTERPGRWPAEAGVESCCQRLGRLVQGLYRFRVAGDGELRHTFWLAADHLTAEEPREAASLAGVLVALLGQVCERLQGKARAARDVDEAQQIRRLLLSRVSERLSIEQIAREIGTSATRAKQVFREAFGSGIIAYFNQLKIWKAQRLLSDPSLTVEQVSQQLGFANAAYFSRVFQSHTGEAPSAFRSHGAGGR